MKVSRSRRRRVAAIGFAALVATAGTAFAASNTVAGRNAGYGASTISGFTVNNISYTAAANPQNISSVTFDISRDVNTTVVDSTNAEVFVSLDGGATYITCVVWSGAAQCDLTESVGFADVVSADVVAYDMQNTAG